jgi:hypothetical protein
MPARRIINSSLQKKAMKNIFTLLFLFASFRLFAQPEIDEMQRMADSLDALNKPAHEYVSASFKGTRLINFPTIESMGKRALDFRIAHRFGDFSSGAYNAFGLDGGASIRLSFDYGITNWLMVGIGRSSVDKLVDGSVKVRILRQTTDNHIPVSVSLQSTMNYTFLRDPNAVNGVDKYAYAVNRISYGTSLVVGRKFSDKLSLQFNGFYIHYNIVDKKTDSNDMFAAGLSGRYKLTKRFAITFEYAHRLNKYSLAYDNYQDPFGIGVDIETGGHVFQLHFTNQFGMNEAQYIPYTTSNFWKGDIRLGFNISRVFSIGGKDKSSKGKSW